MRYWEFLIQQEGDQTWLPLETRQVEILEGRYRMAAHTSYDDTSVEVRVSQLLLDEMPPRRRVRKRKSLTNDSGLLAIFPFMQLSPGRWEIDCNSPDVIDDFLGEAWHYSVHLQVTPRDEDDWEPDWSDATTGQDLSRATEKSVETGIPSPGSIRPDRSADGASQPDGFQLQLKQQAYVTQLGQSLTLVGQLSTPSGGTLSSCQLWVQLRDPQTANPLQEKVFDLPPQKLSSPFSVTIVLPEQLSTQVILGAISLRNQSGDQAPLASASFTVTIGLAQMLDAIANQPNLEFEEEISIFPGSTEAFVPSPDQAETLLTRDTPIIPKELIPSEGLALPPQLKPPSNDDATDRQPELPAFPADSSSSFRQEPSSPDAPSDASKPSEENVADNTGDHELSDQGPDQSYKNAPESLELAEPAADSEDIAPEDPDISLDADTSEPDEPLPFAEPRVFDLGSIEDDDLDLELATAAAQADELPPEIRPETLPGLTDTPDTDVSQPTDTQWDPNAVNIDRAFQKLQLRERFWQKLNLFTQDGYRQSVEVKRALQPSDTLPEGNPQSNEFVAYEPRRTPIEQPQEQRDDETPLQVLPPTLDVPTQELVAGEWIAIRVRIPAANYQPYVKVWMNDLQTRTVIEAPRLLMQFTPNDLNELETLMRVQVPSGCLELQIAAIAVDMATLQESRKVVQNRRVMPPDDTLSIFDDWNV
ncbi:MAG: hypothetical protein AAF243_11375 [Cyanobacteria bacterium P01_A01_bin.137]